MRCIIGLGNPGLQYAQTRHNIGFWVIDLLAQRHNVPLRKRKFDSEFARGRIRQHDVILLKPQTMMNRSGQAVDAVARFYDFEPSDLLIVYDDIALDLGVLRLRRGGSAGGHRGMQNIIDRVGTPDIPRLRLGIGAPPERIDARDYVLSHFRAGDREAVENLVAAAADAVELLLCEDMETAMNEIN
ncbi:MAG: aminoacyl-tRNA hydrolase [Armatimonadota bacterium]